MKNLNNSSAVVVLFLIVLVFGSQCLAADTNSKMGMSNKHDLDQLWKSAQQSNKLADHDAVVLLESRQVICDDAGQVSTRVHRVVWIGSSVGLNHHADLRIGWDSETSVLEVQKLRTWREGRWWPDTTELSPTAIVETLPYAVDEADDYTSLRETMLLHDGVELPCIMETEYTITKNNEPGADGLFVFPQPDIAMKTELVVTVPADSQFLFEGLNGAPEADETTEANGQRTFSWQMNNTPALLLPHTAQPEAYEPAVAWSTWGHWANLQESFSSPIAEAATLSEALVDSLKVILQDKPSELSKLRAITDFVSKSTRYIRTAPEFWCYSPRQATRTWETAYGHGLDRAVLAAAFLTQADIQYAPVFIGAGNNLVAPDVPRLSGLGKMYLVINGPVSVFYDPVHGSLHSNNITLGHSVWFAAGSSEPELRTAHDENRVDIEVCLEEKDEDTWQGTGFLEVTGIFCAYGKVAGLDNQLTEYLSQQLVSLLPGAKITQASTEILSEHQMTLGFGFDLPAPEVDKNQAVRLTLNSPGLGLMHALGNDIHLYDEHRQSPVILPAPMAQRLVLKIKPGDLASVQIPEASRINNDVGSFVVSNQQRKDGWLVITRELKLHKAQYEVKDWPAIRFLLLEETDASNRLLVLE